MDLEEMRSRVSKKGGIALTLGAPMVKGPITSERVEPPEKRATASPGGIVGEEDNAQVSYEGEHGG